MTTPRHTDAHGRPLLYTSQIQLRWGDVDQLGHINNTVYFRCYEQARVEWIDLYPQALDGNPAYVVIVHTECSFLKELKAPGTAEVRIFAGDLGRSSLLQHYELRRTDDPATVYATGSAKMVWVSPETGRSTPVPERFRQLITT
ncbi:acyl-CoA thioesterase [Limnobacter humi]|uniref:Acyl-CoA thioesterase n=1 Tax=Limnobacter humi TaxID=1778671 RepID=A0ABT1WD22_9BURK|nr:thioesterase family protein [Limnobacter humi]MCQ8895427.1 acyl-CoA thioesterase [Limnobacter humi]